MVTQADGYAERDMRQVLVRGIQPVDQMFVLTRVAYNLTRLRGLGSILLPGPMWGGKAQETGLTNAKNARMERWVSRCGKLAREMYATPRKMRVCGEVFQ